MAMRSSSLVDVRIKGGGSFQIVRSCMGLDVLGGLVFVLLVVRSSRCSRIAATAALLLMVKLYLQSVLRLRGDGWADRLCFNLPIIKIV